MTRRSHERPTYHDDNHASLAIWLVNAEQSQEWAEQARIRADRSIRRRRIIYYCLLAGWLIAVALMLWWVISA